MMAVGAFVSSSRCAHAAVHVHKVKGVLETHVLVSRALRGYPTRSVAAWSAVDGGTAGSLSILRQSKDSWHLYFEENRAEGPQQPQRVLLVDGTNLACLCAGGRHKKRSPFSDKLEDRFASWLRFLQHTTAASTVLVAFDNKGSITTNVRAQLLPGYLRKRYSSAAAAAGGGGDLHGWAHLGAVVRQINQQQQQQDSSQQQQVSSQQPVEPCFLVANAAYGYEADDVLAAATEWIISHLTPQPVVIIASSDSDMQQMMSNHHTYWLELMQVPTPNHPSGLRLHSAASFHSANAFPAAHYADYLSLVGKPDASVQGLGVSSKVAKRLVQQFGSVDHIIEAADKGQLAQYGPAAAKLSSSSSSSEGTALSPRQKLLVNKSILGTYTKQQTKQIPQQQMMDCLTAASGRQQQQRGDNAAAGSSACMAMRHPAICSHMRQSAKYLGQISRCLQQLGVDHKVGWLTPGGLWCDLIVRTHRGSSGSDNDTQTAQQQQQQQQQTDLEITSRDDWLVVMLLSPADLSSKIDTPMTFSTVTNTQSNSAVTSYDTAVDILADQLGDRCGCFVQGNSSLGHARKKLLDYATGSVKRRLSLLKGAGWKVAVVPFHELHLAAAAVDGECVESQTKPLTAAVGAAAAGAHGDSAAGASLKYVLAVMQEQCGPAWRPPVQQQQQQQQHVTP